MPRWTKPTTLRPQLCDCVLVYTLDDDETSDPRARDLTMRLVRADVAVRPDREAKQFLGMRDHHDRTTTLDHPEAQPLPPRGWKIETHASELCRHHRDHAEPHRTVLAEGWLVQEAVAHVVSVLEIEPADVGVTATMDDARVLHLAVDAPANVKRDLGRSLDAKIGAGRVRLR